MAVALGLREALEQDDPRSLRPADSVGGGGKGLAAPVGGDAPLAGELDEHAGVGEHGHPAGQGEGALPRAQRGGGEVDRHQRGGAGGVDGDRGALEAEGVGDAATDHAARHPRAEVALELCGDGVRAVAGGVVLVHHPGEDPGVGAAQRGGVDAGVFERLPGAFQEQALLGVHRQRLARAYAEELGVEEGGVFDEAAFFGIARAGVLWVGVIEALEVPAAVAGELGDRVLALAEELPELCGGADPAGVAAGEADDGDRLAFALLALAQLPLRGVELLRHPAQVSAELLFVSQPRSRHDPGGSTTAIGQGPTMPTRCELSPHISRTSHSETASRATVVLRTPYYPTSPTFC